MSINHIQIHGFIIYKTYVLYFIESHNCIPLRFTYISTKYIYIRRNCSCSCCCCYCFGCCFILFSISIFRAFYIFLRLICGLFVITLTDEGFFSILNSNIFTDVNKLMQSPTSFPACSFDCYFSYFENVVTHILSRKMDLH